MAIYRLPPSPFIGGRQPLAPKDLNPAFEAVEEVPFLPYTRPVIALWWPTDYLVQQRQVFTPQAAEEFVPFTRPLIELRSWIVDPVIPQRQIFYPQEFVAAEEKVPYKSYIPVIMASWGETVWLIQTPFHLPTDLPAVVDFIGQGRPQLQILYDYLPLPQRGANVASFIPFTPAVVDDPPFGRRVLILNSILDAWIPPPPMPTNPIQNWTPPTSDDIIIWMWKRVF